MKAKLATAIAILTPAITLAAEGLATSLAYLAAGLAIGLAALGTGIGMGNAIKGTQEGVARNPGASQRLQTLMFIGLAFMETLALYALLVALILLF
ncbi:MAG: ATP synthase F0 subunit C [Aquificaceae bacterium]